MVVVRFGVYSLAALLTLAVLTGETRAESAEARARRAAMEALREARAAEKIARERAVAERQEQLRRALEEPREPNEADPSVALDPFDGFEDPLVDPLDEIDDFGDAEADPAAELAEDPADADAPDIPSLPSVPDPMDASAEDEPTRDDDRAYTRDLYRSAERGLEEPDAGRPYDGRYDLPGLDPAVPDDSGLDAFGEP